jgi:hypothetical protein
MGIIKINVTLGSAMKSIEITNVNISQNQYIFHDS